MRRALAVAGLSLRLLLHDRSAVIVMFAVPLGLTAIMGSGGGGSGPPKTTVAIIDQDQGYYSGEVRRILARDQSFTIKRASLAEARDQVRGGKLDGAVIIPAGFGKAAETGGTAKMRLVTLAGAGRAQVVQEALKGIADRMSSDAKAADFTLKEALRRQKRVKTALKDMNHRIGWLYDRAKEDAYAQYQSAIAQAKAKIRADVTAQVEAEIAKQMGAGGAPGAPGAPPGGGGPPGGAPPGAVPPMPDKEALIAQAIAQAEAQIPAFSFPDRPKPIKRWWKPVKGGATTWRRLYKKADGQWEPKPPVELRTSSLTASKERGSKTMAQGFTASSMGFAVTFVLFTLLGNASGILEERRLGTLGRLLTTPVSKASIVGGKILGVYVTGVVQAAILLAAGVFLFKVDWGSSLPGVALIFATYILAATGLGILISAMVKTLGQAQSLTPVVAISVSMLGGCWWPVEIVPPFMQTLAKGMPTYYAMQALTDLVVRYRGFDVTLQPALILVGFAAVFFTVGLAALKVE